MNLYVLRHGEVNLNKEYRINGRNNTVLNEKGISQAKEAGEKLKNIKIDIVYCSPIFRTKQTCLYANVNNANIIFDDRLMERDSRSLDTKSVNEIDFSIWYDRSREIIYADTEGFKSVQKRIFEFIEYLKTNCSNKNVLIVTHGDVCKAFYSFFNNIENDLDILKCDQKNCEIFKYEL